MLARLFLTLFLSLVLNAEEPASDCSGDLHKWSLKIAATPSEPKLIAEFESGSIRKIYAQSFATRLLLEGVEQPHQKASGIKFFILIAPGALANLEDGTVLEQHSSRHFTKKALQVYRARRTFLKRSMSAAKLAVHTTQNQRIFEIECVGDGSKDSFDFSYAFGEKFRYGQILDGNFGEDAALDLARHLITQISAKHDIQGHSQL